MIKLGKYCMGIKFKGKDYMRFLGGVPKSKEEDLYILFIPKSIVDELKKGVIGEWE